MSDLPNKIRNEEVKKEIDELEKLDMGWQSEKHTGIAQTLALLNAAESLQLLQLQLIETSKEDRVTFSSITQSILNSASTLEKVMKDYGDAAAKQAKGAAWLSVALIFATTVLALFTGFQGLEIYEQRQDAKTTTAANFALQFDQTLNEGTDLKITNAIETPGTPILQPKGQFTEDELENLLADYDTVGELYSEGLIQPRLAWDLFSYDVEQVYENKEVTAYLKSTRAEANDPTLYDKFDYLAQTFLKEDTSPTAKQFDQP